MRTERNLVVRPLNGIGELREAAPFWREVVAAAAIDRLFNSPDWGLLQAEAYAAPKDVFGWAVSTADGAPVALFPFRTRPRRGALDLTRAILLADGTFDSDYLDLPIRPGFEAEAVDLCVDLLGTRRGIDAAVVAGVPDESKTLAALRDSLDRRGLPRRELDVPCAAADLAESFDAYVARLKPRMRSKVRSALRAAGERGARLLWCDEAASLDAHLEGLFTLHSRRWNAAGEAGSFSSEPRRRFYAAMSRDLLARRALRFARLEVDGRAVAYQIGAVAEGVYYQLQEGFEPELADLRVGTMLRGLVVQALIAEGVRRYDYMAGVSQHKQEWGAELRKCTSIGFPLQRLKGRLAFKARGWVERLRAARAAK